MDGEKRAYLELHIAVLLFGFTAILGELIVLEAVPLVWWRVLITSVSLFFLINFGRSLRNIPKKRILQFMGIGVLVALHWITFFGSIKFSNASICLVCLATTSFFTSFLEPIITGSKFKWFEVIIGAMIIPGMILVVNNIDISMMTGIWLGLASALLASMFSILNKKLIKEADTLSITFLELSSAWLFISCIFPIYYYFNPEGNFMPVKMDWIYLLILALLCTTLAYVLALRALKHISAFAANLTVNLEPVYGIFLAIWILNENKELSTGFYWGVFIILLAVFSYPFIKKIFSPKSEIA